MDLALILRTCLNTWGLFAPCILQNRNPVRRAGNTTGNLRLEILAKLPQNQKQGKGGGGVFFKKI